MNFQKYIICEFIAAGQHLAHSCKEWIFLCVGSLPYGITDCGVQKLLVPKSCLHPVYYKSQDLRACKDIENERFCNKLPYVPLHKQDILKLVTCGNVSSSKIPQNYAKIQFLKIFFLTTC